MCRWWDVIPIRDQTVDRLGRPAGTPAKTLSKNVGAVFALREVLGFHFGQMIVKIFLDLFQAVEIHYLSADFVLNIEDIRGLIDFGSDLGQQRCSSRKRSVCT